MQERVASFIETHRLLGPGQSVVAGVSGGPDSVALLHILLSLSPRLGFKLYAAHLNHGIRGEAADRDEQFVRDLCDFMGVPLCCERQDVPAYAKARGMGLEQAGRELRYGFLGRAKKQFGASAIAVAHHMDDQAESILLHLTRGSGLAGLVGMQPRREDIIRPLLFLRRSEIIAYLNRESLAYCVDLSNEEPSAARTRLRLELIPYIESNINPRIVENLAAMAELLLYDESYLLGEAAAEARGLSRDGGYLRSGLLALAPAIRSRVIRQALKDAGAPNNIERVHIDMVVSLLSARTGARLRLPGVEVWNEYDLIFFGRMEPAEVDFSVPFALEGSTSTPLGSFEAGYTEYPADFGRDPNVAYLDADRLPPGLLVRARRPGDRFYPLGAPGRRKLKAFFIDKKVPRNARILPLLASGDEVVFVPGFCIGEPYKLRPSTRRVLRVVYHDIKFYHQ